MEEYVTSYVYMNLLRVTVNLFQLLYIDENGYLQNFVKSCILENKYLQNVFFILLNNFQANDFSDELKSWFRSNCFSDIKVCLKNAITFGWTKKLFFQFIETFIAVSAKLLETLSLFWSAFVWTYFVSGILAVFSVDLILRMKSRLITFSLRNRRWKGLFCLYSPCEIAFCFPPTRHLLVISQ